MTGDRVAEIRDRLEAVPSGEWVQLDHRTQDNPHRILVADETHNCLVVECLQSREDADLIANAPADLAYLLAELDAANRALAAVDAADQHDRAENARLRAQLDTARKIAVELQMLPSRYTRAYGENGERVADLLTEDAYNAGTRLRAAIDQGGDHV